MSLIVKFIYYTLVWIRIEKEANALIDSNFKASFISKICPPTNHHRQAEPSMHNLHIPCSEGIQIIAKLINFDWLFQKITTKIRRIAKNCLQLPEFDDLAVTNSVNYFCKNGRSTDINGIILPRIQRIARMSWIEILTQDAGGVRGKRIGYWSDFSDNRGGWKTWSIAIEGHATMVYIPLWNVSHFLQMT